MTEESFHCLDGSFCLTVVLWEMQTTGNMLEIAFLCKLFEFRPLSVINNSGILYREKTDFMAAISAFDVVGVNLITST